MPIAVMLPSTQRPWKERGEAIASWGARGTHGFSEVSSGEPTSSPEQEVGLLHGYTGFRGEEMRVGAARGPGVLESGAAEQMHLLFEARASPGNLFSAVDLPQSGI